MPVLLTLLPPEAVAAMSDSSEYLQVVSVGNRTAQQQHISLTLDSRNERVIPDDFPKLFRREEEELHT